MISGPPPSAAKPEKGPPPAPFIVGAPRSGTTLLRLMLDAHGALAIPPETGFLPAVLALRSGAGPEAFLSLVTGFESWPDFGLEARDLGAALGDLTAFALGDAVRAFYRLYARHFGKRLWGDKTPDYGLHLAAIRSLLPEAHFIHVIRDGRDVALSLRPLWFAPSRRMQDLAGTGSSGSRPHGPWVKARLTASRSASKTWSAIRRTSSQSFAVSWTSTTIPPCCEITSGRPPVSTSTRGGTTPTALRA